MVKLSNSWVIMNPGGPPTPDKPDISVVDYEFDNTISTFMNLRVADVQACYEEWRSKGAEFVTPPIDRGAEIRCYMRDPDGYLIEVGQSTGLLKGHLAKKRPEDLPGQDDVTRRPGEPLVPRGLSTSTVPHVLIRVSKALATTAVGTMKSMISHSVVSQQVQRFARIDAPALCRVSPRRFAFRPQPSDRPLPVS